eukprot:211086_1
MEPGSREPQGRDHQIYAKKEEDRKGHFQLHPHRDWLALRTEILPHISNQALSAENFWKFLNTCAEQCMQQSNSFNHQLTREYHLADLKLACQTSVRRDPEEWMQDLFTDFDRFALAKAERVIGIRSEYDRNPYFGDDDLEVYEHRTRSPPRGKKAKERRNASVHAANQQRNNSMRNWWNDTKKRLKGDYIEKFNKVCGYYHADSCTQKVNDNGNCVNKRSGNERLHQCVCGQKHRIKDCKKSTQIFK